MRLFRNYLEFLRKSAQAEIDKAQEKQNQPFQFLDNYLQQQEQQLTDEVKKGDKNLAKKMPEKQPRDSIFSMDLDDEENKDKDDDSEYFPFEEDEEDFIAKPETAKVTSTTTTTTVKSEAAISPAIYNNIIISLLESLGLLLRRSSEFFPEIAEELHSNSQNPKPQTGSGENLSEILVPFMDLVSIGDKYPMIGIYEEIAEFSLWIMNDIIVSDTRQTKQTSKLFAVSTKKKQKSTIFFFWKTELYKKLTNFFSVDD